MTKKILLTILLLSLTGCSVKLGVEEKIPDNLKLKVSESNILESKNITIEYCEDKSCLVKKTETFKKYSYISNEEDSIANPRYEKGEDYTSAEYLPIRNDGITPIKINSRKLWYKNKDGKNIKIKEATTTIDAFDKQLKVSVIDKIKYLLIPSSYAATTYTASTTFTPDCAGNAEVLLVGGGGGGGQNRGGGGGGGGVNYNSSFAVTVKSYTVVIGSGGVTSDTPTKGTDTTFDTLTAYGGGHGGGQTIGCPSSGGSGGGGPLSVFCAGMAGGAGTSGQGNGGGKGYWNGSNGGGGGGGGANATGTDATVSSGGNGGNGISNSITGSPITYGGGGGGGTDSSATASSGGTGGGGAGGSTSLDCTSGTDGLGGGAGGGSNSHPFSSSGGDGVFIIALDCSKVSVPFETSYIISPN